MDVLRGLEEGFCGAAALATDRAALGYVAEAPGAPRSQRESRGEPCERDASRQGWLPCILNERRDRSAGLVSAIP